jgi:hypothetical protein
MSLHSCYKIETFINKFISSKGMNKQNVTKKIIKYVGPTMIALGAAIILYDNIPENYEIPNTRPTNHVYGLGMGELELDLNTEIPNIRTTKHSALVPYIKTLTDMIRKSNSNQLDVLKGEGNVGDEKKSYSIIISTPFDPIIQEAGEGDSINVFRYNNGAIEETKITFGEGSKKDYDDYHDMIIGVSPREITIEKFKFKDPHQRKKHGKDYTIKLDTYNKNFTLGDIVERFNDRYRSCESPKIFLKGCSIINL